MRKYVHGFEVLKSLSHENLQTCVGVETKLLRVKHMTKEVEDLKDDFFFTKHYEYYVIVVEEDDGEFTHITCKLVALKKPSYNN